MTVQLQETTYDLAPSEMDKYPLGEIMGVRDMSAHEAGIDAAHAPARIYEVAVRDPLVERYTPEEQAEVAAVEQAADDEARTRREAGMWERKPGTAYVAEDGELQTNTRQWGDPVSGSRFFTGLGSPAILNWKSLVPSAKALKYISGEHEEVEHKSGKPERTVPMDATGAKWLDLCTDAVGIRSRGTVMAEIVKTLAEEQMALNGGNARDFRWMSVACGTALPSMQGAIRAGIEPELLLVDFDGGAMDDIGKLKEEIGFKGALTRPGVDALGQETINIFDKEEMAKLQVYLGNNGGRPRMIDAMGIFEYTGELLEQDPVEFLKLNYDMLHPGGKLVFGQMRDTRPVPDFTMGVVGWPYIEMRSPDEVMKIIVAAGIDPNTVTLYLPEDGVYTVVAIDKPDEQPEIEVPAPRPRKQRKLKLLKSTVSL